MHDEPARETHNGISHIDSAPQSADIVIEEKNGNSSRDDTIWMEKPAGLLLVIELSRRLCWKSAICNESVDRSRYRISAIKTRVNHWMNHTISVRESTWHCAHFRFVLPTRTKPSKPVNSSKHKVFLRFLF